ncbi:MAG: nucleotidyltransferase [Opitutus sp.]|nr:nucleotidyltransferase [Opitutus sp.]
MQSFSRLLAILADHGLDFVIVGGYAAVTHGSSYVTKDVDICIVFSEENIARLRDALRDLNPRHRMLPGDLSFLTNPQPGTPLNNLYLRTDLGVVDILSSVLGVGDFAQLCASAEITKVDGRSYRLMSLPDLIRGKEALGREKDLLVAKELRVIAAKRQAE